MKYLILTCAMIFSGTVGAQGTGAANAEISDEKKISGFCMDGDPSKDPEITGLCNEMTRQFNENECLQKLVETLRKRFINEGEPDGKGGKKSVNLGFSCSADPYDGNKTLSNLAKTNKGAFTNLMKQYVAMLISQYSGWDVLKDETKGSKGPSGILPLTLGDGSVTDMDNPDYECACKKKVVTTSDQTGVTVPGQSPGPLDSFHTATCGPYMILNAIAKDGETSSGDPKSKDPDKKPKGAATILPTLFDRDEKKAEKQAKWRDTKMQTYCKQFWNTGGDTRRWDGSTLKNIGGEQLKDSGATQ